MLYGIGSKALGEQLGVEENDAGAFMEMFKSRFPGKKEKSYKHLLHNQFRHQTAHILESEHRLPDNGFRCLLFSPLIDLKSVKH